MVDGRTEFTASPGQNHNQSRGLRPGCVAKSQEAYSPFGQNIHAALL